MYNTQIQIQIPNKEYRIQNSEFCILYSVFFLSSGGDRVCTLRCILANL
jgi:hypothetical protein